MRSVFKLVDGQRITTNEPDQKGQLDAGTDRCKRKGALLLLVLI